MFVTVSVGVAWPITKLPAASEVPALYPVAAGQSATTAYEPASVCVAAPSIRMLKAAPPPEHVTVAVCGDPVYTCGEFVTVAVWSIAKLQFRLLAAEPTEFAALIAAPLAVASLSCTSRKLTDREPVAARFHCVPDVVERNDRSCPEAPFSVREFDTVVVLPAAKFNV